MINKINAKKGIILVLLSILIVFIGLLSPNLEGKVLIPVEIKIRIQENPVPDMPFNIIIDVESRMPFKNGHIYLILPGMGNLQSQTIELWSGDSDNNMKKHLSYLLPALTPGEYEVRASFKFDSTQGGEQEMGVMEALYIDVRVDKILTSNISFTHIKQLELKEELGSKGLKGLSFGQIKEKNPEMAERIARLNKIETVESNLPKEDKSDVKDFIYNPAEDRIDNPETNDQREIKKSSLTGTKEAIAGSNQPNHINKEEKDAFRTTKAPLTGTKEAVAGSNQPNKVNKEEKDALRTTKAPLTGTKEAVAGSNQLNHVNKEEKDAFRTTKAPLTGTKEAITGSAGSNLPPGADKNEKDSFRAAKAPLTAEKEYISVPNQPQGLKDKIPAPAKAPLESIKEIVEVKTGEMKKNQVAPDLTNDNYKNSIQANEKRKALEKK
ncbi:MAG TPA: hypothetical protein VK186_04505 [Candidatus Deferrimicrobium sp.]|nr:hypothetical protein [Candidatus Deferrimicrobium sp.]